MKDYFTNLYNEILEIYKDAFAIYFDKSDYPTQKQYELSLLSKDELFADFYIIKKINDNYELLECAYFEYYEYNYNDYDYSTVDYISYEVLTTQKYESLDDIVKIIPNNYIDKVKVISNKKYSKKNNVSYKINNLIIANEENKELLIEAFIRLNKAKKK